MFHSIFITREEQKTLSDYYRWHNCGRNSLTVSVKSSHGGKHPGCSLTTTEVCMLPWNRPQIKKEKNVTKI